MKLFFYLILAVWLYATGPMNYPASASDISAIYTWIAGVQTWASKQSILRDGHGSAGLVGI